MIFGVIAFAILANICYTGGWVVELLLSRLLPYANTTLFGLRAFRFGLVFSVFITIFPALLSWVVLFIALKNGQKHAP